MTRWAFLGAGTMAGAMVRGLIAADTAKPEAITCIGGNDPTAANLSRSTGIRAAETFGELLECADVLIVACKPQTISQLPPDLAQLTAHKLVVSIAAGKRLKTLAAVFPSARNIVRVMPNTPAQIGAGVSGWCSMSPISEDDRATLLSLLNALGCAVEINESEMDALTAVSGSGPAYLFEFVAALREAGINAGLKPETAAILAQETILGAARLLARSEDSPETLRDRVTSPKGTTFAALESFKANNFRGIIQQAIDANIARSIELAAEE